MNIFNKPNLILISSIYIVAQNNTVFTSSKNRQKELDT